MFAQYYFALPILHNVLHNCFYWKFYHFTCLPILEGDIEHITNFDYDKYLSIAACGKSGVSYDEEVKVNTIKRNGSIFEL